MNLYIVRHGESIGNTQRGFISGRVDKRGLTTKGKSQIIRVGWELKNIIFQNIFTSPVVRCLETAQILSAITDAPIGQKEFLNELDHGLAEGHFWWEVKSYFPKSRSLSDWHEDFDSPYVKGESFRMLSKRVWGGYCQLIKNNKNGNYLLVTHQAVISTLIYCHLYGDPEASQEKYLDFVHSTYTANGTYLLLSKKNNKNIYKQCGPFRPLTVAPAKIKFYSASFLVKSINSLRLKKITTASHNQVFFIKNKVEYLIKIIGQKQTTTSLRLAQIYNYLDKKTAIPVPRIVYFDKSGVFFKNAVLIQDYQYGVEESSCLKKHPRKIEKLQLQIYQTIQKVHAINKKAVAEFWELNDWYESYPSWNKKNGDLYLARELDLTIDKLQKLTKNKDLFNKTISLLKELRIYVVSDSYRLVPLHGDLAPQNLIISHKKGGCQLVRILDFERVRIGDRLWDLSYYYGWLQREDKTVADYWKNMFWPELSSKEKRYFHLYLVLFHAWTVRDGLEYAKNRKRQLLAKKSLIILEDLLRPTFSPH